MGKLVFLLLALVAVVTSQEGQQQQFRSQPQQSATSPLYQPPQQQDAQAYQYQPPQQSYQLPQEDQPQPYSQKYNQPQFPQHQYQQPQYQQPQYQQPQYQQPQYQQPQPPQHQYQQPQFPQHQPSQGGHRQSKESQPQSTDNTRPWWYAASPVGGIACQNAAHQEQPDRSGRGRAIQHNTPQQFPENTNQQQRMPQGQDAGWKDQTLEEPSKQYQPPPPVQDYYRVAVPANEIPNYIQRQNQQQQYQPQNLQNQQQQRRPNEQEDKDDDDDSTPKPRYPLTPPSLKFKIGLISDLGKDSATEEAKKFKSFFKIGHLLLQQEGGEVEGNATIEFDEENNETNHVLETGINTSGQGFELSTLNYFNGKLYSCDDETGIIYELVQDEETKNYTAHPWVLLPNAEGGFKCEWATVKDDHLWVGSVGVLFPGKKPRNETNETEDDDEEENVHDDDFDSDSNSGDNTAAKEADPKPEEKKDDKKPTTTTQAPKKRTKRQNKKDKDSEDKEEFDKSKQNIKKITKDGRVIHVDWTTQYEKMAEALGINQKKGFVVHEAAAWSDIHQKWLFTPRRLSKEKYDRSTYFKTGTNCGIWTDDQWRELEVLKLGEENEGIGFTDVKFIPGTDDKLILALKSGLEGDKLVSSLAVYNWEGKEIMKDTVVADGVFAGVEFL